MQKGLFDYTEHNDGSIRISYTDHGVGAFGGGSYEAIYDIDTENRKKLEMFLSKPSLNGLEEMIVEEFGERLDKKSFARYLNENGVEYKLFTWIDD